MMSGNENYAELLKEALSTIRRQKAQLKALKATSIEPVAVVGLGCLLPPAIQGPAAFWATRNAPAIPIAPMPSSRNWFERLNRGSQRPADVPASRSGVFFDEVLGFDVQAFGISNREAESMDPQHRVLLEVTWNALEDALIPPDSLSGSSTGVFVGLMNQDYGHLACADLDQIRVHTAAGNGLGVAAGRIAHAFGLTGPAIAVDTNCSSSLVAVHLAAASLRARECDLAVAAGVNLILSPTMNVVMAKANALSPTDRCRSFDARANGYARGEGCGGVVLKRLSDALEAGDRIYAVVRGSAVNHGGRTSALSVPSPRAQDAVMRRALQNAQLSPGDVDYLETHGTGTPLGDPIELEAIHSVYGDREKKLYLGSVKNTLGHLEGAAGIVSFIRAALALHGEEIPPFGTDFTPTPHFDWASSPLEIPTMGCPWTHGSLPRRAAVSAFGFSGTNCHVLLEEAPLAPREAAEEKAYHSRPLTLCLSAASSASLDALIKHHCIALADCDAMQAEALCHASHVGRSTLEWRAVFNAPTVELLVAQMEKRARSGHMHLHGEKQGQVCVFLGDDWSWYCAQSQADHLVPFRAELLQWLSLGGAAAETAMSLLEANDDRLPVTSLAGLLMLQVAALRSFRDLGFRIEAVEAHGISQVASACAAGVLSRVQALALLGLIQAGPLMPDTTGAAQLADVICNAKPWAADFDLVGEFGPVAWQDWCRADFWYVPQSSSRSHTPLMADALPVLPLGVRAPEITRSAGRVIIESLLTNSDPFESTRAALVQLFLTGGRPEWRQLRHTAGLWLQPVPPYPFERKPLYVAGTACDPSFTAISVSLHQQPTVNKSEVGKQRSSNLSVDDVMAFLRDELNELVGVPNQPLSPDTTWSDAGIDSLMALEIRNRLGKAYDVQLPTQLLTQIGTLRSFAEAVLKQARDDTTIPDCAITQGQLIPVRSATDPGRTLVLVHAVGGTVQSYFSLARRLNQDISVIAIASSALPEGITTSGSITDIAHNYLELLNDIEVAGDLVLGGWSMGGLIALEMAALSRARGRPVSRVVLIDSIVVEETRNTLLGDPQDAALSVFALDLGLSQQDLSDARASAISVDEQLQYIRLRAIELGLLSETIPLQDLLWYFRLMRQNFDAFLFHRPGEYVESVDYFKARDGMSGALANSRHLTPHELCGPLREWSLPGSHFSIVREPHVIELAKQLNASFVEQRASTVGAH